MPITVNTQTQRVKNLTACHKPDNLVLTLALACFLSDKPEPSNFHKTLTKTICYGLNVHLAQPML